MLVLIGGLALFLFGVRLAGENLQALLGPGLRRLLARVTRSSVGAALAGLPITALVQSGTLISVVIVQFVDAGVLGLTQALAAALGGGVGGTLTVQLLSLNIGHLSFPLLTLGLLLGGRTLLGGRLGRVAFGLGLLFLGLDTLIGSLEPLRQSALFGQVLAAVAGQPLPAGVLGLALAVLVQSSNAAATLAVAFVAAGFLSPEAGLSLVVGANVGTTLTAVWLSRQGSVDGQRVALGHFGLKLIGAVAVLALIGPFTRLVQEFSPGPLHLIANGHTLFNLLVLVAALPFGPLAARALQRLLPTPADQAGPRYLSAEALREPELAYGLAFREVVRVADEVQQMYRLAAGMLAGQNHQPEVIRLENAVDDLVHAVVLYLAQLGALADRPGLSALIGIASELEALADLNKRLARQPLKLERLGGRFSSKGAQGLSLVAAELGAHMASTFTALALRRTERGFEATQAFSAHVEQQRLYHLDRLADNVDAQRSSSVHLDVLTILEQMNAGLTRITRLAGQI